MLEEVALFPPGTRPVTTALDSLCYSSFMANSGKTEKQTDIPIESLLTSQGGTVEIMIVVLGPSGGAWGGCL